MYYTRANCQDLSETVPRVWGERFTYTERFRSSLIGFISIYKQTSNISIQDCMTTAINCQRRASDRRETNSHLSSTHLGGDRISIERVRAAKNVSFKPCDTFKKISIYATVVVAVATCERTSADYRQRAVELLGWPEDPELPGFAGRAAGIVAVAVPRPGLKLKWGNGDGTEDEATIRGHKEIGAEEIIPKRYGGSKQQQKRDRRDNHENTTVAGCWKQRVDRHKGCRALAQCE